MAKNAMMYLNGLTINQNNQTKMKKKLEFKDIARFLPYGLNFAIKNKEILADAWADRGGNTLYTNELEGGNQDAIDLSNSKWSLDKDCFTIKLSDPYPGEYEFHCLYNNLGDSSLNVGFSEVLPLLRPESALIEEIEHNNKKIIPLVEIAKIAFPSRTYRYAQSISDSLYNLSVVNTLTNTTEGILYYKKGSFWYDTKLSSHIIWGQQQINQLLEELLIDTRGLISQGLAKEL